VRGVRRVRALRSVCVCVCVCLHLANIGSVKGADKEFVVCTVDGVAALECDHVAIGREARKKLFGGLHLCVCVCVCEYICMWAPGPLEPPAWL